MKPEQQKALQELATKSLVQIQVETAFTWAYRSWAARTLADNAKANGDLQGFVAMRHDATEYEHEAIEHAALSDDDSTLDAVRAILKSAR